jgi:cysteinyl-tRNA synthetase
VETTRRNYSSGTLKRKPETEIFQILYVLRSLHNDVRSKLADEKSYGHLKELAENIIRKLPREDDALDKEIDALVAERGEARKSKNFKEADRIRDELAATGVVLKDAKDPATGEIITTWELAR